METRSHVQWIDSEGRREDTPLECLVHTIDQAAFFPNNNTSSCLPFRLGLLLLPIQMGFTDAMGPLLHLQGLGSWARERLKPATPPNRR
jgi:hypothetical protein